MAAEATLQDVTNKATKDAYKALAKRLSCLVAFDVHVLERNPGSVARRAVIAEAVDELSEDKKISVKTLATELAEALETRAGPRPNVVRRVVAERSTLEGIDVSENTAREAFV